MDALEEAVAFLPSRLAAAVQKHAAFRRINEIRLRRLLPLSVTVDGQNRMLDERGNQTGLTHAVRISAEEMRQTVSNLCEGSVYRHVKTLTEGFLVTSAGVRVGLCGETVFDEHGRVRTSLNDFTGLNLRIPRSVRGAADELLRYYAAHGVLSTLVYSKPGVGKTTLLRDLALRLSAGDCTRAMRVCVADERRELFPASGDFLRDAGLLDVISGAGKAHAIEVALRLFSPEVIVCDELGAEEETEKLLAAQNSGVLFCASVHADRVEALWKKPNVRCLLEAGVFDLLCGISKSDTGICLDLTRAS